ncbi:hypothetical protein WJX73_005711 [Symbiochloris irregularis]|uniref:Glutathione peroxidase n=1 Tax=Symbiochloris irregularis TaxID=706552 RepID=A0AAW1Q3U5_9CHLO
MGTRARNSEYVLPVVVGTVAFYLGKKATDSSSHRWTLYMRHANGLDLSQFVKKVVYQLHSSFAVPHREITTPPFFDLTEHGWGEFEIAAVVHFTDDAAEKPVELYHKLKLYTEAELSTQTSKTTKIPVVAETYEELVFSDPTEAFRMKFYVFKRFSWSSTWSAFTPRSKKRREEKQQTAISRDQALAFLWPDCNEPHPTADTAAQAHHSKDTDLKLVNSPSGLYAMAVDDTDGRSYRLDQYAGQVSLVVNVASQCGYTDSNYIGLQKLYEKYHHRGFEVLAFPCNAFGQQEPGSLAEIQAFATEKYHATFPIFPKPAIALWDVCAKRSAGIFTHIQHKDTVGPD